VNVSAAPVFVTDFDGTLTRHDFYQLVIERLLPPHVPDFWAEYRAGRLTHFEALRVIFRAAEGGEPALAGVARDMGLEPALRSQVAALHAQGWRIVVASAGCDWYIRRLLDAAGVRLEIHANPGRIEDGRLVMELPVGSPYLSTETGINKAAIVRDALASGGRVAFAGDGGPDLGAALLVPADRRFACGYLAEELAQRGESFRPFDHWAEVAEVLRAGATRGLES